MQCVILVAGRGTRMRPLTDNCPKPLVKVAGKPLLDHIVEALPSEITELVLVVGYRGEMIREYCKNSFLGRTVTYCEQKDYAGGTGDALLAARGVLRGKFLFMYGDDIHGATALKQAVREEHAVLGAYSETPERYGVLIPNPDGTLGSILEKPKNPPSNFINIGGYVVDESIFRYTVPVSESGELYVTDMITAYAQVNPVKIIEQNLWIPIGYPEDIAKAETALSPQ